jgi:hypothetical protein
LCIEHGGVKLCKVPNCPKMDRGRGFYSKHGSLLGLGGLTCTAPECTRRAVSKGLCCQHGGMKRCAVKKCQKMERVQGYCNDHAPTRQALAGVGGGGAASASAVAAGGD